jgi:hypothetical protein
VGVTRFPPPPSDFARGVVASDILTFFDIAATRATILWGVTANLCLRRRAIGEHRFLLAFPREGGGEDIDLCLRIVADAGGVPLACVPTAIVTHPWWSAGRRHYKRFFRWAFGDSILPTLHPQFRYRATPTLAEMLAVVAAPLVALAACGRIPPSWFAALVTAMVVAEFAVEHIKLRLRGAGVELRTSAEATVVRLANEGGRLVGHVRAGRLAGFCERFDYFGTGESIRYERRVAGAKFALWLASGLALAAFALMRS